MSKRSTHDEEDKAKGKGDANPFSRELPEWDDPVSAVGRCVRRLHRQTRGLNVDRIVEAAPVGKARACDDGDWHAVVGDKAPDVTVKVRQRRDDRKDVADDEREDGKENRKVNRGRRQIKLTSDDLDPVLNVDPAERPGVVRA